MERWRKPMRRAAKSKSGARELEERITKKKLFRPVFLAMDSSTKDHASGEHECFAESKSAVQRHSFCSTDENEGFSNLYHIFLVIF